MRFGEGQVCGCQEFDGQDVPAISQPDPIYIRTDRAALRVCHDFATLRLALIRLIQRIRDFSSREINFYAAKADYALCVAVGPRIDTVGGWGSNPHAPTNFLSKSALLSTHCNLGTQMGTQLCCASWIDLCHEVQRRSIAVRYSSCVTRRQRRGRTEYVAVLSDYDHSGKRRQKRLTAYSFSEAKRIKRELEDEYLSGGEVALFSDNLTFEDLVTHCQQTKYCKVASDSYYPLLTERRAMYTSLGNRWRAMSKPTDLVQGTLGLLILKMLALEPLHGWAIGQRLKQVSDDTLQVSDGSLYPALHKLEQEGWIKAEWKPSENNRRAKFYTLTRPGRKELEREADNWNRLSTAISLVVQLKEA